VYEEEPVAPKVAKPMKEVAVTPNDEIPVVENPGTINSLLGLSLTKLRH
jgi:hypothetical protein